MKLNVNLLGLVFVVFLSLKLAGIGVVAGWSWWWVTCPLWIGFAVWGVFVLAAGVVVGLAALFTSKPKRRSRF